MIGIKKTHMDANFEITELFTEAGVFVELPDMVYLRADLPEVSRITTIITHWLLTITDRALSKCSTRCVKSQMVFYKGNWKGTCLTITHMRLTLANHSHSGPGLILPTPEQSSFWPHIGRKLNHGTVEVAFLDPETLQKLSAGREEESSSTTEQFQEEGEGSK